MLMEGKFIVVDGIDASGKGTIIKMLAGKLNEYNKFKGIVFVTREPTSGKYGKQLREMLKDGKNPKENADKFLELYVKDRKEHIEKEIIPALNEGKIVISDRFKYSTYAYQLVQGNSFEEINEMHVEMIQPELALILNLSVETALERLKNDESRTHLEVFEKKDFLEFVRENFFKMPEWFPNENIQIIDASRSREEVFNDCFEEVKKVLEL